MKGIVLYGGSGTILYPITEGVIKLRELAKPMMKNQYGQYLMKIAEEVNLQGFN